MHRRYSLPFVRAIIRSVTWVTRLHFQRRLPQRTVLRLERGAPARASYVVTTTTSNRDMLVKLRAQPTVKRLHRKRASHSRDRSAKRAPSQRGLTFYSHIIRLRSMAINVFKSKFHRALAAHRCLHRFVKTSLATVCRMNVRCYRETLRWSFPNIGMLPIRSYLRLCYVGTVLA